MKKNSSLSIWKDAEALSIAAAHFFVAACQQSIIKKGNFVVALSGGNTPKRLYQLLASPPFSKNIDWKKVFLFWSDERFVPHTDTDSNYRMVKENLLDHISIPTKNIFAIPVKGQAKACAEAYEKKLKTFFAGKKPVIDWLLLGTGDDGHTASLFPGTSILAEKKRLIREVWVEDKQSWRLSFTFPLINQAATVIFLIAGKEKAPVVKALIKGKTTSMPAQLVDPSNGTVSFVVDEEAASALS